LNRTGLLLAAALGVAGWVIRPAALAQAPDIGNRSAATLEEVVITAGREADEALSAKLVQVLQDDPYVFADHMSVVTEHGVVRLRGIAVDLSDLRRALTLAHQVAGRRRVVNEVELIAPGEDHD
jgi:osmotically-inducible protein OsmY